MADRIIAEGLLFNGRGIRIEKVRTKAYREATKRAFLNNPGTSAEILSNAIAHELLLTALRGTTAQPLEIKFKPLVKADGTTLLDPDGKPVEIPDIDATLDAAPPGAWRDHTYQSLVTAGDSSLDEVLGDPKEFEDALKMLNRECLGVSPLGRLLTAQSRNLGGA